MAELVKDVVCGMEVDPESAAASSEYQGATYHFCSSGCKQAFDAEPQKYLDPNYQPAGMPEAGPEPETQPAPAPKRRWWEFWKA